MLQQSTVQLHSVSQTDADEWIKRCGYGMSDVTDVGISLLHRQPSNPKQTRAAAAGGYAHANAATYRTLAVELARPRPHKFCSDVGEPLSLLGVGRQATVSLCSARLEASVKYWSAAVRGGAPAGGSMSECRVQLRRDTVNTPWGFRLQGGQDYGGPLVVQRVSNFGQAIAGGSAEESYCEFKMLSFVDLGYAWCTGLVFF